MQLRGKEDLRLMRSVGIRDCCPETGKPIAKNEGDIDENLNVAHISQNSQNWNETHYRLFGDAGCSGSEKQQIDVEYAVEHYQFTADQSETCATLNRNQFPADTEVCVEQVSIYGYDSNYSCAAVSIDHHSLESTSRLVSNSSTLPALDQNKFSSRQSQQLSRLSLQSSPDFSAGASSNIRQNNTLPITFRHNRQCVHKRTPSLFSSLCKQRTLNRATSPFCERTFGSDNIFYDLDRTNNTHYPANNHYSQIAKECCSLANDRIASNERYVDNKSHQIEDVCSDQLLNVSAATQKRAGCIFNDSKLVLLICFITVIALLAMGSLLYIIITPEQKNITSTTSIPSLQTHSVHYRQVEICGKPPENFTVKKPHYDDRIPTNIEDVDAVGDYDDIYYYGLSPLSFSTMKNTETSSKFVTNASTTTTAVISTDGVTEKTKTNTSNTYAETTLTTSISSTNSVTKPEVSSKSSKIGKLLIRRRRVVGGRNVKRGGIPWQVSLWVEDQLLCGGSLVTKRWIVTAAHCIDEYKMPFSWTARVGLVELSHKDEPYVQLRNVSYIYANENYSSNANKNYDVALFQVEKQFKYNEYIQPICLPPQGFKLPPDADCSVSGWGYKNYRNNGKQSNILQQATVNIIERDRCNEWLQGIVADRMMCAGEPQGGRDACFGDSGGPLSYFDPEKKVWVLAGIVSWGDYCGRPKKPGVYTVVGDVSNWLWTIIIRYDNRD